MLAMSGAALVVAVIVIVCSPKSAGFCVSIVKVVPTMERYGKAGKTLRLRVAPHYKGANANGTWIEVGVYPLAGLITCTSELPLTPAGGVSAERTHCIQICIDTVESVTVVVVVDLATRVKV